MSAPDLPECMVQESKLALRCELAHRQHFLLQLVFLLDYSGNLQQY